jgi:hypothetical protein
LGTLRWLCQNRLIWEVLMTMGTWFTLALEISLPFLVWVRGFRPIMVLGAIALHTAIALTMGLTVFSLLMATLVMSFIPGELFEGLFGMVHGRLRSIWGVTLPSGADRGQVAVTAGRALPVR